MKEATLFIVRKPHQGDTCVDNVLNYITSSPFADLDGIMTNEVCDDDLEQMIQDFYSVQEAVDMVNHRAMFHMVLSTRHSKVAQAVIDSGAAAILDYFTMLGHQVVLVPHDGSQGNCWNYHYHIAVNPISLSGKRLLDKYETYNNIRDYLNAHTRNSWSWRLTSPKSYQKYIY